MNQNRIPEPVTPERWNALTRHLRIRGQLIDSMLHKLAGEGRGVSWDRPDEKEPAS
jgi:hypothetical protein